MVYVRKRTPARDEATETVRKFLAARTRPDPGGEERTTRLYRSFDRWATVHGKPQMDMQTFLAVLESLGYPRKTTSTLSVFCGLVLLNPCEPTPDLDTLRRLVPGDESVNI